MRSAARLAAQDLVLYSFLKDDQPVAQAAGFLFKCFKPLGHTPRTKTSLFYSPAPMDTFDRCSPGEQLARLEALGLKITDRSQAEVLISKQIGFNRLREYLSPLMVEKTGPDLLQFKPDASIEAACQLYAFDRKLKLIALDALERTEVAVRVALLNNIADLDPLIHHGEDLIRRMPHVRSAPERLAELVQEWRHKLSKHERRCKDNCVAAFRISNPNIVPPIWISIEAWDFGMLQQFFRALNKHRRKIIAIGFGFPSPYPFEMALSLLNSLRNCCAHHERVWNRKFYTMPKTNDFPEDLQHLRHLPGRGCYEALTVLNYIQQHINPDGEWGKRAVFHLYTQFPKMSCCNFANSGFPAEWYYEDVWQREIARFGSPSEKDDSAPSQL